MLQWGRDQLVAEIPVPVLAQAAVARLQWGRDQLVAEINLLKRAFKQTELLQWGRDQLVAEIGLFRAGSFPNAQASMGPRPIGRGNACSYRIRKSLSRCFNGAATNWSRKCDIPPTGHTAIWCFNGAATNWSRKYTSTRVNWQKLEQLQWGRDQLVAEIVICTVHWTERFEASMGPRPIGRGNE